MVQKQVDDLTDAVAQALSQPFAAVSMEMVYRSLYYFSQAAHRGKATDVVAYLAANAKLLGIRKRTFTRTYLVKLDLTSGSSP